MRNLFLGFAALLFLTPPAHAAPARSQEMAKAVRLPAASELAAVALNAAAGTRTVTYSIGNAAFSKYGSSYAKLRFGVQYTYSAATTVTVQASCSYDGTTYYRRTTKSCASGTCTAYKQSDTYTTAAASADLEFEYDIRGCSSIQIVLGGASADASDLVTTQAVAIVGD